MLIGTGLLTTVACSAQPDAPRPEPALGPVPLVRIDADVRFPLDDYLLSPEHRVIVRKGQDVLVQRCLRRFGFEMDLPDREVDRVRGRVIGVVDPAEVAEHGYSDPETIESVRKAEQVRKEQKPWPEDMIAVLNGNGPEVRKRGGVPDGGCLGEAQRMLGLTSRSRGEPGDENFVIGLSRDSSKLAEADSRLKEAWRKWSACMKDAGYDYADPWGPNGEKRFSGDDASPEEIATARADVACREEHGVNGIWVAVRTAYQNRIITDNADALRRHRGVVDEQVRKATAVVPGKN
ncbi:hypothetical protein [Lentzea sp.]|uniref:hypothetical protein n=1 Tax=Lentzea sp. TaxID=56099 RepID=UPI002B877217|nr:hypothetical protein [Lentzea sp.]HUQ58917.1 hypothetical protein [Lentzea sp.]